MEAVTGARHGEDNSAIDGCSIPTYAVPLKNLAIGFARMATGEGLSPTRAAAARRLMAACMAEPFYIAGTGSADTRLMQAAPGRVFVKVGAEGVYCAALPELGLGVALKCAGGVARGAEVMVAATLSRLLGHDQVLAGKLAEMARPPVMTRKGVTVGMLRPTEALAK
jgi:L-asparaginase II